MSEQDQTITIPLAEYLDLKQTKGLFESKRMVEMTRYTHGYTSYMYVSYDQLDDKINEKLKSIRALVELGGRQDDELYKSYLDALAKIRALRAEIDILKVA